MEEDDVLEDKAINRMEEDKERGRRKRVVCEMNLMEIASLFELIIHIWWLIEVKARAK